MISCLQLPFFNDLDVSQSQFRQLRCDDVANFRMIQDPRSLGTVNSGLWSCAVFDGFLSPQPEAHSTPLPGGSGILTLLPYWTLSTLLQSTRGVVQASTHFHASKIRRHRVPHEKNLSICGWSTSTDENFDQGEQRENDVLNFTT